ncbi:hypothetical protein 2011_scaffold13_00002 [Bacteriophage sp.]|nr:hypothetical protein 2011_scaffold13_00002 [Bacteriophage sp.]
MELDLLALPHLVLILFPILDVLFIHQLNVFTHDNICSGKYQIDLNC